MGGRGASSGISNNGKKYGTEYTTLYQSGNIKFIRINEGSSTAPMETMTKGRVYVNVNAKNDLNNITYYDNMNKRVKQIDLLHKHMGVSPHTHHGYEHRENDTEKGFANVTDREKQMIERVKKLWKNFQK